jgi:hypothetical protein
VERSSGVDYYHGESRESAATRFVPSSRPARSQGLIAGPEDAGAGAVSRMNCSIAAAIAAASSGDAGCRTSMRGRAGLCLPFRLTRTA